MVSTDPLVRTATEFSRFTSLPEAEQEFQVVFFFLLFVCHLVWLKSQRVNKIVIVQIIEWCMAFIVFQMFARSCIQCIKTVVPWTAW